MIALRCLRCGGVDEYPSESTSQVCTTCERPASHEPVSTHDFRDDKRRYGWDIVYRPAANRQLSAVGWAWGIARGDYVLLTTGLRSETRYQVTAITYPVVGGNHWTALLVHSPVGSH